MAYLTFLESTILHKTSTLQLQNCIRRLISFIIIVVRIVRSEIRHVPEATNMITILHTERYNSAGSRNIVSDRKKSINSHYNSCDTHRNQACSSKEQMLYSMAPLGLSV